MVSLCKEYFIRFHYKEEKSLNILSASFNADSIEAAEQRGRMLAVSFGASWIEISTKSNKVEYIDCPPTEHGLSIIDRALKEAGHPDGVSVKPT